MAGFDTSGLAEGLARLQQQQHEAGMRAVERIADEVLARSTAIVPHEDGDLQASGQVSLDRATTRAAVSYNTPYAVVQHEDMTLQHDSGRTAKYLERALASVAAGPAMQIIADEFGRPFKGGA